MGKPAWGVPDWPALLYLVGFDVFVEQRDRLAKSAAAGRGEHPGNPDNPYGIQLYYYLLRSLSDARLEIWVWYPLALVSPFGFIYLFILASSVTGFIYSRRHRSVTMIILFSIAAILPLLAKRNFSLFAVAAVMLAGEHIADLLIRAGWMRKQAQGVPIWASGVVLAASLGIFMVAVAEFEVHLNHYHASLSGAGSSAHQE